MRWFLPFAVVLAACGPGASSGGDGGGDDDDGGGVNDGGSADAPEPEFESGSRLKAIVLTTPDGTQYFNGWHDTMLDEDCWFDVAADGQLRCLPAITANA